LGSEAPFSLEREKEIFLDNGYKYPASTSEDVHRERKRCARVGHQLIGHMEEIEIIGHMGCLQTV
jgi:hypothetical protein